MNGCGAFCVLRRVIENYPRWRIFRKRNGELSLADFYCSSKAAVYCVFTVQSNGLI